MNYCFVILNQNWVLFDFYRLDRLVRLPLRAAPEQTRAVGKRDNGSAHYQVLVRFGDVRHAISFDWICMVRLCMNRTNKLVLYALADSHTAFEHFISHSVKTDCIFNFFSSLHSISPFRGGSSIVCRLKLNWTAGRGEYQILVHCFDEMNGEGVRLMLKWGPIAFISCDWQNIKSMGILLEIAAKHVSPSCKCWPNKNNAQHQNVQSTRKI